MELPSPVQRPGANVALFDGECVFCRSSVALLARLDWLGTLSFLSLHDPSVPAKYPSLTHDALMAQMYVVDPKGGTYGGAAAIRYLSLRLPLLWLIAPLLHVPGTLPMWQWLYAFVARNRYRILGRAAPCDGGTCQLHLGSAASHQRKN